MKEQKETLRKLIKTRKSEHSKEQLLNYSTEILKLLCFEPVWAQAEVVLLYYSLPDEVYTHAFIERWCKYKKIILPVVVGDELELRVFTGSQDLVQGSFNILEPSGELFLDYDAIDLVIVPGVAFDICNNRLGRGKGFYDKLLPKIKAYKLGICFPFQFFKSKTIPVAEYDIPMDKILTQK